MKAFETPGWAEVFVPDASLVETFLRASVVYLSLVVLFRVILKRQGGTIGLPDVMLVVLVSECVSPALTAQANSVPNGLVAVLALLFWNFTLDWAAARSGRLRRLLEPQPVQLVRDGEPLRKNLDAEGVTDDELAAQLRGQGVDDVGKVKAAFMESEGTVSVIPKEKPAPPSAEELHAAVALFLAAAEELRAALARHPHPPEDPR